MGSAVPTVPSSVSLPPADGVVLQALSARLAAGETVADGEVAEALGDTVVPAFRYAQEALSGLVRKTTGEPAFCHSADIALRARLLAYDAPRTLSVCLLHDVVEEQSNSLADASEHLRHLEDRFGAGVAGDVRLLTNVHSLLIAEACDPELRRMPFGAAFLDRFSQALEVFEGGLSDALRAEFRRELDDVRRFVRVVDVGAGLARGRSDRTYAGESELRLQAYRLFLEELCDAAAHRFNQASDARGDAETPLVCKLLDLIDNLRTSPVVVLRSLERTLVKTELFLDCSFYLHDLLHRHGLSSTFVTAYDLLKYHLVQQLRQRRLALASLSDLRFGFLARHLMDEGARLEAKYRVEPDLDAHIDALSDTVRRLNTPGAR